MNVMSVFMRSFSQRKGITMKLSQLKPWNWFKKESHAPAAESGRIPSLHSVSALQKEMDRLFEDFYRGAIGFPRISGEVRENMQSPFLRPVVDITEAGNQYRIRVEIPGVEKDDIHLGIEDDTLVISGEKKMEKDEVDGDCHWNETSYGSFQRMLSLPEDACRDNLSATFKNGVLTITFSKMKNISASRQQIPIS